MEVCQLYLRSWVPSVFHKPHLSPLSSISHFRPPSRAQHSGDGMESCIKEAQSSSSAHLSCHKDTSSQHMRNSHWLNIPTTGHWIEWTEKGQHCTSLYCWKNTFINCKQFLTLQKVTHKHSPLQVTEALVAQHIQLKNHVHITPLSSLALGMFPHNGALPHSNPG